MRQESFDFLKSVLKSPSPSGYEQPVQEIWRAYTSAFSSKVYTDVHGNSIGAVNPQGTSRVLFAGHCDEIGFMVRYIEEKGFLYFG
ncbi:MAG: M42 family peptidase, partial [Candidatus Latescibacterota bacterium]